MINHGRYLINENDSKRIMQWLKFMPDIIKYCSTNWAYIVLTSDVKKIIIHFYDNEHINVRIIKDTYRVKELDDYTTNSCILNITRDVFSKMYIDSIYIKYCGQHVFENFD